MTTTDVIQVMIIDDHAVFTESLATALDRQEGIEVVATSSGDEHVVPLAAQRQPDQHDGQRGTDHGVPPARRY